MFICDEMTWLTITNTTIGMVQQGLSVPPPLRRGGGQRISTGLSIPPSGRAAKNPTSANKAPPKPRRVRTKKLPSEDTESEEFESESDAEYGKPRVKRAKIRSKPIPHTPTPSTSESEEEIVSSAKRDIKRELSDSSNDESSDEDDSQKGDDMDGDEVVAAGANFLDLVDDVPTVGQPVPGPVKSLIIKLPATKTIKPESSNLGRNDLDHLATVASGLPTYTSDSSIDTYPGFDLSVHNHHHYPQADHEYNTSEFLSAGYGARDGLPEPSLYGSMISQPHMSYSNGLEHFGDTNMGDQPMAEDGWNPTGTEYHFGRLNGSCAFATPPFPNAHGTSTTAGHLPLSLPQLSTSFMLKPAIPEHTVGGEYFSSGSSTIDHTPSSNLPEDSVNVPWLTRDGSSARQATGIDINNVDSVQASDEATLHQRYDGYGDSDACF